MYTLSAKYCILCASSRNRLANSSGINVINKSESWARTGDGPSYYPLRVPTILIDLLQKKLRTGHWLSWHSFITCGLPGYIQVETWGFSWSYVGWQSTGDETYIYGLLNESHPTVLVQTSSMQLPPGPLYLLRTFPSFAVPSTIVYACLTLAKEHLSLAIPTWLTVFATLLARPVVFIFNRYYSRFADSRAAAANNAVVAPRVRESPFSIISKMSHSLKEGYPGAFWCWP